jgi:hypothetical protein
MAKKPDDVVKLNLRFDEKLRRRLERSAAQRGISMNSEILNRIEQSFDWESKFGTAEKMLQEASVSLRSELDAHLRAQGFYPVATVNGTVWLSPGMDPLKVAVCTEPTAFQKAQEEAMRAIFREIVQQARPSVRRAAAKPDPQARDPLKELANIIADEDPFHDPAATLDPTKAAIEAIEEALARVPPAPKKEFDTEKITAGIEKAVNRILRGTPHKVAEPPRISERPSMSKKRA